MATLTKQQLTDRIVAAKLAIDAVNRKNASLGISTYSTAMAIPEVEAFQKIDGTLTVDRLYGPNTKTAITWYLQEYQPAPKIPNVNQKFASVPVTWKPPTLEAAPTVSTTTTAPKTTETPTVSSTTTAPKTTSGGGFSEAILSSIAKATTFAQESAAKIASGQPVSTTKAPATISTVKDTLGVTTTKPATTKKIVKKTAPKKVVKKTVSKTPATTKKPGYFDSPWVKGIAAILALGGIGYLVKK